MFDLVLVATMHQLVVLLCVFLARSCAKNTLFTSPKFKVLKSKTKAANSCSVGRQFASHRFGCAVTVCLEL